MIGNVTRRIPTEFGTWYNDTALLDGSDYWRPASPEIKAGWGGTNRVCQWAPLGTEITGGATEYFLFGETIVGFLLKLSCTGYRSNPLNIAYRQNICSDQIHRISLICVTFSSASTTCLTTSSYVISWLLPLSRSDGCIYSLTDRS